MFSLAKKIHIVTILFLAFNVFLSLTISVRFDSKVLFFIKLLTYFSGIALFFLTYRHKKLITFYSFLYILTPLVILLAWLADGIFGAILGSIFFYIWAPPDILLHPDSVVFQGNYFIHSQFGGFLSGCCSYEIVEQIFFLFEREAADFRLEVAPSYIDNFKIHEGQATIYYRKETYLDSATVILKKARF